MDEVIQRKIDEILEMADAAEPSDEKHVVTPRTRENDSLLKVIRNEKMAKEFLEDMKIAFERARRRKGL
ncbi:hypothetical protein GFS24_22585 [Chitinophaga sp. SYP-B3965]|uniref:hypothetical protein n=1 Tax=Chitinophaga sp. SYP-B3965 TaxID=2663120 RepID=UPI001299584C|nr:hypothetical protein [Chitinophaga sp. SYP-B3965]MRG47925.1 hypothetical protein [Chitinophaga sp. SYP-B3965]